MKKIILLLCFVLSIEHIIGSELLAHWDFNCLGGNQIFDKSEKYPITVEGNLLGDLLQPGLNGQAFHFGINANRLSLPHGKASNLTNDFTITFEMKPKDINGFRAILWKGNRSANPEIVNYAVDMRDGMLELKYKNKSGKWIVHQSRKIIESEQWYHVIVYYNSGNCEIYVNGKEKKVNHAVYDNAPTELISTDYDCLIGRGQKYNNEESFFFSGLLDDLRIYSGRHIDIDDNYQKDRVQLLQNYERRMELYNAQMIHFKKIKSRKLADEYKRFFYKEAENNPFGAMLIPVTKRLLKKADFFKNSELQREGIFSLSAARREFESAQLVVLGNPDHEIRINSIQISELTSADGKVIPSANTSIGKIGFVNTEKPDIPVDFVGAHPDPIFLGETALTIEAGGFGLACIRINGTGVPPGIYNGDIRIKNESTEIKVPIRIKIYDFELPARTSLRATFSFFESFYKEWYGLSEISLERRLGIYNFLLQYRLALGNIYAPLNNPSPSYDILTILKDRCNFFTLPSWGSSMFSSKKLEEKIAAYSAEIEQARMLGIEDQMYVYLFDEILGRAKDYPAAEQATSTLKEAFPGIKLMQTSFPEKEICDYFNVWIPLFYEFARPERLKVLKQLKARGDEIWWYAADDPVKPFPNFFLDYPVFDCRIIGLLSYMYQVDGLLYWSINREWRTNIDIRNNWPEAEWKPYISHISLGIRKSKNGMGNLVYPGRNGELLPSLRLENLRDGLEDYEYMSMLKKLGVKLLETDPDRIEAEKLLSIPSTVAKAVNDYSADPLHLMKYREKVAHMIEKLNKRGQ